jgi:hypothetical protein
MAIRANALRSFSAQIESLERKIEGIVLAWMEFDRANHKKFNQLERVEKRVNEYKMALIHCRDMIEDLMRLVPKEKFEAINDAAIFMDALSLSIGDGPRTPFKHVDVHNAEMAKQQAMVRRTAEAKAKEVAKELNAKRKASVKKGKKK